MPKDLTSTAFVWGRMAVRRGGINAGASEPVASRQSQPRRLQLTAEEPLYVIKQSELAELETRMNDL